MAGGEEMTVGIGYLCVALDICYKFIMEPEHITEPGQLKKKKKNKGWDNTIQDP